MPYKDKAKRKENDKKNKEHITKRGKEWRLKNKEKRAEYLKIYEQTPKGKKRRRLGDWKRCGVICDDFDELYEKYINTNNCELCEVELTEDKRNTTTTKCLDHDHDTGLFRNVVCLSCNQKLPRQT